MPTGDMVSLSAIIGLLVAACSIAAFLLGRRKEANLEGKNSGIMESEIKNISRQIQDMKESFDKVNTKLEVGDEKREREYRETIIKVTELLQNYKSLHKRVDCIEDKVNNIIMR